MDQFALVAVIAVALAFDFFNGFHDAANSIATVVSTRVLSPRLAVGWAAFWNFAALLLGTSVATTIACSYDNVRATSTIVRSTDVTRSPSMRTTCAGSSVAILTWTRLPRRPPLLRPPRVTCTSRGRGPQSGSRCRTAADT